MPETTLKRARVAFNTLGCKLNQYESDALASRFLKAGYSIVPFADNADVYIINSCTVTNKADRKTRNILNRALRFSEQGRVASTAITPAGAQPPHLLQPARAATLPLRPPPLELQPQPAGGALSPATSANPAMVVITGCFVDSHRGELEKDGRSFVVGNEHKNNIFELVDAHLKGEIVHPESFRADRFDYSAGQQVFRTRGMVKIQDGCDNFCSFCIIPFVRGKAISRNQQEILNSARQMLDDGYRELVLTGVNMSRYNDAGLKFSGILEQLLELDGDYRLRISSIEPDQLDDHFIHLLGHERMTEHLHLCLQSGSEKILLRMRRQYTYHQYRELVEKIRHRYPNFNITSDIIVGFPGEGEEEFAESRRALGRIGFGHVHVFKYSIRKGTRAERMDAQVSEATKSKRSDIIRSDAECLKRQYRSMLIGETQRVLVERVDEDASGRLVARGFGEHYVPLYFQLPDPSAAASTAPPAASNAALASNGAPSISNNASIKRGTIENEYVFVRVCGIDEGENPDLRAEMLP